MATQADDQWNGRIFSLCYACIYFAAPVLYIGVVQAALCDKLGASNTLANLPASAYSLGQIAPLVFSWLVPHRLERTAVVAANAMTAALLAAVFLSLVLPVASEVRIVLLTVQGLLQGLSASTSHVFMIQCLGRGTTTEGRARALKRTFTITPILAVAGSLTAQYILNPGLPFVGYPYDFALLYGIGTPCMIAVAVFASRFRLEPIPDEPRRPFFRAQIASLRNYFADPALRQVWIAYLFFYIALGITSNLALFTREAVGRDPKDLSGVLMAIRFGFKSLFGLGIGWLAVRHGLRAAVLACIALTAASGAWAWVVPGYAYVFSFGLIGGGELGGAYIPNLVGALSTAADGARNLAIITLATPASSPSGVVHGLLTDRFGFQASFAFAIIAALVALVLVWRVKNENR